MVFTEPSQHLAAGEVILHEYVHQVLHHGTSLSYPLWYDEGMAEFFSTVEPRRDSLAIGSPPKTAASWIQYGEWLPFERVLAARSYLELEGDELAARDLLRRMIAVRSDAAKGQTVDAAIAQIRRRRDGEARRVGLPAPSDDPTRPDSQRARSRQGATASIVRKP